MNKILISLMAVAFLSQQFGLTQNNNVNVKDVNATRKIMRANSNLEIPFEISTIKNFSFQQDNIMIEGNYTSFDEKSFEERKSNINGFNVYYDMYLDDNVSQSHDVLRNNVTIYYYKNNKLSVNSFKSNETNLDVLFESIESYVNSHYNEYLISMEKSNQISLQSTNNGLFEYLYSGSFTEELKPYGYVVGEYIISKYRKNDVSSLYLLDSTISFTPGIVAKESGISGYDTWYNKINFIKLSAERAQHEVGYDQIRYGGTPVLKDAFPNSNAYKKTIMSTYSPNNVLGFSFTNGFSLNNIDASSSLGTGAYIDFYYNKIYDNSGSLKLNDQIDITNSNKYMWQYSYNNGQKITSNMKANYMFEMNNSGHDLFEGDLAVFFEYEFTVTNNGWAFFEKTKTVSDDYYANYY